MNLAQPKGDSFGGLNETVLERRLVTGRYRSLRERQLALLVICAGTLMIVIDTSVVNVALPTIQQDLHFSQPNLAWVVNAYLIPFGGLLLFAGRLGDLIGPKRLFVGGIGLFTLASLGCGLAQNEETLIAARFVQGIGGALASAVVLSMLVAMFPKPSEQAKAIGVYSFVASAGAALGLFVGAGMTDVLNWHWIFFVNVPIGVITVVSGLRYVDDERELGKEEGLDLPGAILITGTLMLAVYTIIQTSDQHRSAARIAVLTAVTLALLAAFVVRQVRASNPLIPLSIFRARNVSLANVVQALMVAGVGGVFFLGALYMRQVLGFSVFGVGFAFLPTATAVAVVSLKITPKLMDKVDPKTVLIPGLLLITVGLLLLAVAPADGSYWVNVLPAMVLLGIGAGLGYPSGLTVVMVDATTADRGLRSGLVNTTQQMGPALGLAVLATVADDRTTSLLHRKQSMVQALTSGYHVAFLVGAGFALVGVILTLLFVKPAVPKTVPNVLDQVGGDSGFHQDQTGLRDPDFLALGLGGTAMMAMLWTVAMGRRAVGVELRGSPYVAPMRWSLREDLYHHLLLIDKMMLERYGEDMLPRRGDGRPYKLAECFYSPHTSAGSVRGDEVVTGFEGESHVAGVAHRLEIIDDRYQDGLPHRKVTYVQQPDPTPDLDMTKCGRSMRESLDSPSIFQVGAEEMLIVLRRYLEEIEEMDLAQGRDPRVRLLTYHRVAEPVRQRLLARWLRRRSSKESDGFVVHGDGRRGIRVEAVRELDYKGSFRRVRVPNSEVIDLGVPKLFMVAEGQDSSDARRLGLQQEVVHIDHNDGRGPVPAQADYLAGNIDIYFDTRIRRRIASEFDKEGNEYWIRQYSLGHEEDAQIAWTLLELPEWKTFDPIAAGLVPRGTDRDSKRFFAGHQFLLRQYFTDQLRLITGIPSADIEKNQLSYGPKLFTIVERIGTDALVAANGVIAGDSFGNGHYINSGGINTGMVGHGMRVLRYWQAIESGVDHEKAVRQLADGIKEDTQAWIDASAQEFAKPPVMIGTDPAAQERARQLDTTLAAARAYRRSIIPQIYPDEWSRIHFRTGRIYGYNLPPIPETHPAFWETGPAQADDEDARIEVAQA